MTERITGPHYGMVVTDATGIFMLLWQVDPLSRGDGRLVWSAYRLDMDIFMDAPGRDYQLLLDPDQFGEVTP